MWITIILAYPPEYYESLCTWIDYRHGQSVRAPPRDWNELQMKSKIFSRNPKHLYYRLIYYSIINRIYIHGSFQLLLSSSKQFFLETDRQTIIRIISFNVTDLEKLINQITKKDQIQSGLNFNA